MPNQSAWTFAQRFNLIEGFFWIALAAWFVTRLFVEAAHRRDNLLLAVGLLLFGLSDFVEIHTGAWWRPWWLLVWKGLCLVALVVLLWRRYTRRNT